MNKNLKCPHCLTAINLAFNSDDIRRKGEVEWQTEWGVCPSCDKFIIYLNEIESIRTGMTFSQKTKKEDCLRKVFGEGQNDLFSIFSKELKVAIFNNKDRLKAYFKIETNFSGQATTANDPRTTCE